MAKPPVIQHWIDYNPGRTMVSWEPNEGSDGVYTIMTSDMTRIVVRWYKGELRTWEYRA